MTQGRTHDDGQVQEQDPPSLPKHPDDPVPCHDSLKLENSQSAVNVAEVSSTGAKIGSVENQISHGTMVDSADAVGDAMGTEETLPTESSARADKPDDPEDAPPKDTRTPSLSSRKHELKEDSDMVGGMKMGSKKARLPFKSPLANASPESPRSPSQITADTPTPAHRHSGTSTHFKSPLVKDSGNGSETKPKSAIMLSTEIGKLEKRIQLLRQAIRYKKLDKSKQPHESEERLTQLCEKWTQAGRDAMEMFWKASGSSALDPSDPSLIQAMTSNRNGANAGDSAFSQSWGWASTEDSQNGPSHVVGKDEKESEDDEKSLPELQDLVRPRTVHAISRENDSQSKPSSSPDGSNDGKIKWNMGELARLQGINPELFGWNSTEEDWETRL